MAPEDDDASSGIVDPRLTSREASRSNSALFMSMLALLLPKFYAIFDADRSEISTEPGSGASIGPRSKKACSNCGHVTRSKQKINGDHKHASLKHRHGAKSRASSLNSGLVDPLGPPTNERERISRNAAVVDNGPHPPPAGPRPTPVTKEWRKKRAAILIWEYRQELKRTAEEAPRSEREAITAWVAERIKHSHEINYWKAPRLRTGKPDIHLMGIDGMNASMIEIIEDLMATVDYEAAFTAENDWVGAQVCGNRCNACA